MMKTWALEQIHNVHGCEKTEDTKLFSASEELLHCNILEDDKEVPL